MARLMVISANIQPVRRQRGAGTLIVVLVLFFVMSLVAAYASRNMIFEQKTSANQYRSTQAFEAAEAGVEWALGMFNSGSMDDSCTPVTTAPGLPTPPPPSFRQRYLTVDDLSGVIVPNKWNDAGTDRDLHVLCVRTTGGWSCNCPTTAEPALAVPTTAPAPAFRLKFRPNARPGVVTLVSQGCTRLSTTCLNDNFIATGGDATATITTLIALKGSISTPPSAALTVRGAVTGAFGIGAVNTDPLTAGLTIHAGSTIDMPTLVLRSLPGTPVDGSVIAGDHALAASTPDLLFSSIFGMGRDMYRLQPAAIVRDCPAQCDATNLAEIVRLNPGRMLWLQGDVDLAAAVDLGTPLLPVVIVVNGHLTTSATPVRIFGLVYSVNTGGQWVTSGSAAVYGAGLAEGGLSGTGSPNFVFDPEILRRLRILTGSYVRVPGGWKDFL